MTKRKRCDSPEVMLEGRGASSSSAPEAQLGATHPALGLPRNGCDNSRVRRIRLGLHLEMVLEGRQ